VVLLVGPVVEVVLLLLLLLLVEVLVAARNHVAVAEERLLLLMLLTLGLLLVVLVELALAVGANVSLVVLVDNLVAGVELLLELVLERLPRGERRAPRARRRLLDPSRPAASRPHKFLHASSGWSIDARGCQVFRDASRRSRARTADTHTHTHTKTDS
jgi:hypothetical protein